MKEYEEFWSKIGDLIRLITKSTDDYDEKYMKIKFNSDNELPLNKTTKNVFQMLFFMKKTSIIHMFSQMNVYLNYE